MVKVKTMKKHLKRSLTAVEESSKENRHNPVKEPHPQREVAGSLPVLRPRLELPESPAVLSMRGVHLEEVAEPQDAGRHPHLGEIQPTAATSSAIAAVYYPHLGQFEESIMRVRTSRSKLGTGSTLAEEPAALIAHGGVCEGGGSPS